MTFVKYFFITSFFFLATSCNFNAKSKKLDKELTSKKDTTKLLNIIKQYEPKIYKGTVPKDFYTYFGAFDFWRFPLVYPYSIGCIDVTEYGNIYSDKEKKNLEEGGGMTPLTDYFNKFTFDKLYFIGSKFKSPFDKDTVKYVNQFFIFSFENGTSSPIDGIDNLHKKLKEIKFSGDTTFMTIKEFESRL